ncbi:hypothetical protein PPTG_20370, partial [Phytophthora nicotianae INRA-310]
ASEKQRQVITMASVFSFSAAHDQPAMSNPDVERESGPWGSHREQAPCRAHRT